jgi:hypothetical protein
MFAFEMYVGDIEGKIFFLKLLANASEQYHLPALN